MSEAVRERIYLGPMTTLCPHFQALRFEGVTLNCCHNGKASLPSLSDYPSPLKEHLKVDSVVMLLRNLYLRQRLCNGTRLIVTNLIAFKQQFFRVKTGER